MIAQLRQALIVSGGADHQRCAHHPGDLHRRQAHRGTSAVDQDDVALLEASVGDDGIVRRHQRERQRRGFLDGQAKAFERDRAAMIRDRIFGIAARA
jgi:hypothetical protein